MVIDFLKSAVTWSDNFYVEFLVSGFIGISQECGYKATEIAHIIVQWRNIGK